MQFTDDDVITVAAFLRARLVEHVREAHPDRTTGKIELKV
jgi:hypothetical protein